MKKYLVEFFGTLFFLFVILNSSRVSSNLQPLLIGLSLAIAIMVGGKISGGNYNPAVSIMMYLGNKLNQDDVIPYILSQIMGGIVALKLTNLLKL
jgi:glycerol uptake facilitator-like aquaporin